MGLVGRYKERSIFKHPESEEEFQELFDRLIYFNKNKDTSGVFTVAMQLIPDIWDVEE